MFSGDRPNPFKHLFALPFLPAPSAAPFLSPVVSSSVHPSKEYQSRKLEIRLFSGLLGFLALISLVQTGFTSRLTSGFAAVFGNEYGVLLGVFFGIGVLLFVFRLPFALYSGVALERAYGLMQQSVLGWLKDLAKGLLVGGLFGSIVLAALYWCMTTYGSWWWLPLGVILFLLQLVMAVVGPKILLPFFYKLRPLEDKDLRERIEAACIRAGIRSKGVFVIGFAEKTKKANAALTGLGPSKRIVLSDTLLENMKDDEIEAVFAHEVGHLKLRHIWLGIGVSVVTSFVSLYAVSVAYAAIVEQLGTYPTNIAYLPLLGAILGLVSTILGPLTLWISRLQEYAADRFSARFIGRSEPLINALTKLSRINLADPDPHPVLEFLTFSHPAVKRRVARLRELR